MRRTVKPPIIEDNDRLGLTLFLAAILHGIVILGVSFSFAQPADTAETETLDIILVQTHNESEADDARYLAQVSQQGGGNSDEQSRPRDIFTAPSLSEDPGLNLQTSQKQIASLQQPEQVELLHQQQSEYTVSTDEQQLDPDEVTIMQEQTTDKNTQTARLAQELSSVIENDAQKPKVQYLNSSTREFVPARYMRQWIDRVEHIGNLNYPDQARRARLSGTLILDVVINAEGELVKTDLRRSSGHKVLDDAALRIVRLAAPYQAFPPELKKEADVIHITRRWEFMSNSKLRSR